MAYFREIFRPRLKPAFWAKTFLHLVTPGGYGYIRELRSRQDASYNHERDKHEVRHKHHGQGGWRAEKDETVCSSATTPATRSISLTRS